MKETKSRFKKIALIAGMLSFLLVGVLLGGFIHPVQTPQAQTGAALPAAPTSFAGLAKDASPAKDCLLYTSPSPRDRTRSRMPSSA